MYLIRLDDASEYMDIEKWDRMEKLLDKFDIKPIVGVIPNNRDADLVRHYAKDAGFWDKARMWQTKDWAIALHGYTHVCSSKDGGINPVNCRSEFAGVPLPEQKKKIGDGIRVFRENGLSTKIFFAPSHTFDLNTLEALRSTTDIRIISDTIANDIYKMGEFYFIPQQSGRVRRLPFKIVTFCYHPNIMHEQDFNALEAFLVKYGGKIGGFKELTFIDKELGLYDKLLKKVYFSLRNLR